MNTLILYRLSCSLAGFERSKLAISLPGTQMAEVCSACIPGQTDSTDAEAVVPLFDSGGPLFASKVMVCRDNQSPG